jgi:hypothetical protein
VNPPYAVAGKDIEPGMTIILAPGDDAFVVSKVEPYKGIPNWLRVIKEDGRPSAIKANDWYAQVDR